jgi:Patatin-like phospholipase
MALETGRPKVESSSIRIGIALSGGGIRSATFGLGLVQHLAEAGVLRRTRYLAGVSGGSYLAAAMAISHAYCPPDLWEADPPEWAQGSPEESHLRRNLSYLAPGSLGRMWLFANALYGLLMNLLPLVLAAGLLGRLAGIVLGVLYPRIGKSTVDFAAMPWVGLFMLLLLLCALGVVASRRFRDHRKPLVTVPTVSRSEQLVVVLLTAVIAVVTLGVLLPIAVDLVGLATNGKIATSLDLSGLPWSLRRMLLGLLGLFLAVMLGLFSLSLLRARRLPILQSIAAVVAGSGVIVIPFILAAATATRRSWATSIDGPSIAICVALLVLFSLVAHNRRYSLHPFYRERLQEAFVSRRRRSSEGIEVEPIPYAEPIKLTDVASRSRARSADDPAHAFPEIVMCAAVAARGNEVPTRARAASFTFDGRRSGNVQLKLSTETANLETGDWIGGGGLTLPAIMAISGAALSPLMGRFTLPTYRLLLATLNVRLGVWLRNPQRPTPRALSELRLLPRVYGRLKRAFLEPGAWFVLKEGLGLAGISGRYIHLADGGHWENLGLTELLRRRCTHVIIVDASADPQLADIGRAISIARAELGAEVQLDPRSTIPNDANQATSPVAVGRVTYADNTKGEIYYVRSVIWDGAPVDLQLLADRRNPFPNHPTADQFLSGETFDAYRALGHAVGGALLHKMYLPPETHTTPQLGDFEAAGLA